MRSIVLVAAVLLRIRFVKICKIGVFLARISGYTKENEYFLSVYSFFCICSTNSPSTWNSYSCVFGMCANTRTPKITVFISKICHFVTENWRLSLHTPIRTSHCIAPLLSAIAAAAAVAAAQQRDVGGSLAAARRRWWQREARRRRTARRRQRGGSSAEAAAVAAAQKRDVGSSMAASAVAVAGSAALAAAQQRNVGGGSSAPARRWRQLGGGAAAAAASAAVAAAQSAAGVHSATAAARLQQCGCFGGSGSTTAQRHNLRSGK